MKLYEYSILGNEEIPDNEKLAAKFKEVSEVKRKMMIDTGIAYELGKNRKDLA